MDELATGFGAACRKHLQMVHDPDQKILRYLEERYKTKSIGRYAIYLVKKEVTTNRAQKSILLEQMCRSLYIKDHIELKALSSTYANKPKVAK